VSPAWSDRALAAGAGARGASAGDGLCRKSRISGSACPRLSRSLGVKISPSTRQTTPAYSTASPSRIPACSATSRKSARTLRRADCDGSRNEDPSSGGKPRRSDSRSSLLSAPPSALSVACRTSDATPSSPKGPSSRRRRMMSGYEEYCMTKRRSPPGICRGRQRVSNLKSKPVSSERAFASCSAGCGPRAKQAIATDGLSSTASGARLGDDRAPQAVRGLAAIAQVLLRYSHAPTDGRRLEQAAMSTRRSSKGSARVTAPGTNGAYGHVHALPSNGLVQRIREREPVTRSCPHRVECSRCSRLEGSKISRIPTSLPLSGPLPVAKRGTSRLGPNSQRTPTKVHHGTN
jgi:hypothetical protein